MRCISRSIESFYFRDKRKISFEMANFLPQIKKNTESIALGSHAIYFNFMKYPFEIELRLIFIRCLFTKRFRFLR